MFCFVFLNEVCLCLLLGLVVPKSINACVVSIGDSAAMHPPHSYNHGGTEKKYTIPYKA